MTISGGVTTQAAVWYNLYLSESFVRSLTDTAVDVHVCSRQYLFGRLSTSQRPVKKKRFKTCPKTKVWSLTGNGSVQLVVEESLITCNEKTTTTTITSNSSFAYRFQQIAIVVCVAGVSQ